ncbi:MAG: stage III sporulation protein AA, partial [Lachnospiraceae bacterium]|nr:stage III sporulation protein AA [Lachnospiraceae bacterium]
MQKEEILHIFPDFMRTRWEKVAERAEQLQEIRLRVNQPVTVLMDNKEWFLETEGGLTSDVAHAVYSNEKELEAVLTHVCRYSIY